MLEQEKKTSSVQTVSYTHLDAYKRQYYDGKLVVTLDDALTPIKGETIFTVLDKVGNSPKAKKFVYGKDVYKRQVLGCEIYDIL